MPATPIRATASALLLATFLAISALPVSAQYLYLDANGDGVNSAADLIAPTGTTTLEVWLKTDTNRDGTPAVCPTGEELTINSYEFILHAANGQMNWLGYTNLQPDMVTSFGLGSNATDYHNGFGGGVILPRGTYHLGTLQVSVALGTPSLSIVTSTPLSGGYLTEFGSQCLATDQDNSMKLGLDWFDADGVAYGGSPQAPPVLQAIADFSLNEATVGQIEIGASDSDLQPLQFSKVSGPPFMTVATLDPGQGTAQGRITLTPNSQNAGVSTGTVRVTDGIASDEKSFTITVLPTNEPPVINAATEVTLPAMTQLQPPGHVTDPDGDVLQIAILAAPAYFFYLNAPYQSVGSLAFDYRLRPGANEVGREFLMLEARDGTNVTRQQVRVDVTGFTPAGPPPPDLFTRGFSAMELGGSPSSVAAGDFDGDGDADLAAALPDAGLVQVGRSDAKGGLSIMTTLISPKPMAVAAGDLDHDGVADFAFVDAQSGDIAVLRGVSAGDLTVTQQLHAGAKPVAVAMGDVSGDGWLDAVVLDRAGSAISVLLNDGTGILQSPQAFVTGANCVGLALGEFTGDAKLDAAVIRESPNGVDVLINSGAGVFLPAIATSLAGNAPVGIAAGDVDHDGLSDLAISRFGSPLIVMRSAGAGAFGAPLSLEIEYAAPAFADLDGDGNLDLLSGQGPGQGGSVYVRFGTGTGAFSAPDRYFGPVSARLLTAGDMNADGVLDLVMGAGWGTSNSGSDGAAAIFLNRGDGKLGSDRISGSPAASGYPVLADFNSDGHLDVAGGDGVNLGVGDGTFQALLPSLPATDPPFSTSQFRLAADLNGDGHLDLLSTRDGSNLISIRIGDGAGHLVVPSPATLSSQLTTQPRLTLATGDFNEDGYLDLVVGSVYYSQFGPGPMELWLGRGGGLFEAPTLLPANVAATSIRVDDIDEDGHQDILVVDFWQSCVVVVSGNGDGTFDPMRNLFAPSDVGQMDGMALGDMNGDGRTDVAVNFWYNSGSLAIALQRPDHTFLPPRPIWTASGDFPATVDLVDLDGDTHLDLVTFFQGSIATAMGVGNGSLGLRRLMGPRGQFLLTGDVNEDGYPDIVMAPIFGSPSGIGVFLNQSDLLNRRLARSFQNGGSKTTPVGVVGRDLCLRVEPVGGSYENADIDLSSIVMKSVGTGSVNQIVAIPAKKLVLGDSDGNGVAEISACFAAADLGRLFSKLTGRQDVPVVLAARIAGGGRLYSEVTLTIVHTGPSAAPSLSPNPLNPTGVFRFVTTRPGRTKIQLFDVQGRLVRSVVDRALPAGTQEVLFDGKDGGGRSLASGIYFARVETTEGQYRMRVAIVK